MGEHCACRNGGGEKTESRCGCAGGCHAETAPVEARIAKAKSEWESVVDALPQFICLLDADQRIVRANRSVGPWACLKVEDVVGESVHDALHPDCSNPACALRQLLALAWENLTRTLPTERSFDDPVIHRHVTLNLLPVTRKPGADSAGAGIAVLTMRDTTESRRFELAIRSYSEEVDRVCRTRTDELEHANQLLGLEVAQRGRAEAAARRTVAELRKLSEQLLVAQDTERRRIAADLHDNVCQALNAAAFALDRMCDPATASAEDVGRRDAAMAIVRHAIEETRALAMGLHPSTLTDLGIVPTIAWYCREFRTVYAGVDLDVAVELEEPEVPAPIKTPIFRIMQEALTNVIKHAGASAAHVALRRCNGAIELHISDDGAGFDPNALADYHPTRSGFGVTSMRERAENSGGMFRLESAPGSGTVIGVTWPIGH